MAIIKTQKKEGVALILILIIVASLTMTVMASIKIITKSHTKYTTGKGYGKAINANKASGKFICYKGTDGKLKQVTIKYNLDGSYEKPSGMQSVNSAGNCVFTIQNAAESYKITLIGGGGGGAVPHAVQNFNKTVETPGEDTIIVGSNQTRFKDLFTSYGEYIDAGTIRETLYTDFFANMTAYLKAPDAPIKSGINGSVGGTCTANIFGGTSPLITELFQYNEKGIKVLKELVLKYGNEPAEKYTSLTPVTNENSYLLVDNKKLTAFGGLGAIYNDSGNLINPYNCTASPYYNYNNCKQITATGSYRKYYTSKGVGRCNLFKDNGGINDESSYSDGQSVANIVSNATSISGTKFNLAGTYLTYNYGLRDSSGNPQQVSNSYNVPQDATFNFAIKENTVDIYEATPGEPGYKSEFETKYLTKDDTQQYLEIKPSAIGAGGKGGVASSPNGQQGSPTKLTLDTIAGSHTLIANGGAGGKTKYYTTLDGKLNTSTDNNIGFSQLYQGKNGVQSETSISGDLGVNNLMTGVAQSNTTSAIAKATLPGSSGASGTLAWQGLEKGATNPWLVYKSSSGEISLANRNVNPYYNSSYSGTSGSYRVYNINNSRKYYTTSPNGGEGADGAIIIEW